MIKSNVMTWSLNCSVDMHPAGPVPGPLAAVDRLAGVVVGVRATRQPGAGRRAGARRAGRAASADVEA